MSFNIDKSTKCPPVPLSYSKSCSMLWDHKKDFEHDNEKGGSSTSLEVNFDANSRISSITTGSESSETSTNYGNSSMYYAKDKSKLAPSTFNAFLDALSKCLWKCSPGCQQIPKKTH